MQDRTINNALLALRKSGGTEGMLAEVLLRIRGVDWPTIVQDRPLRRGEAKTFLLAQIRQGPMTTAQLTDQMQIAHPTMKRRSAYNRCFQALLRLEDSGLVVRGSGPDGCLWKIV